MSFTFEKNKLKNILGDDLYASMKKHNLIIAGGTLTSLFTGREINDIDVYSRTNEEMLSFVEYNFSGNLILSHTKKSTLFHIDENAPPVQAIHYRHFNDVQEIFDSFDFTVCQAAYDFKTEEFVMHPDFLKHCAQRQLRFNSNTDYPIVSALRVQKYEDKGFNISKAEFIRIILTCMQLEINSYEELKEHLGGMYGANYDRLFEDMEDEEFDLQTAINKIADFSKTDDYFEKYRPVDVNFDEVLGDIDKSEVVHFEHRDRTYRVYGSGNITQVTSSDKNADRTVSLDEAIPFTKIYKFVEKHGDERLTSFYDSKFTYNVGEIAEAKGDLGGYGNAGKLYFNLKEEIEMSHYFTSHKRVLVEAMFKNEDLVDVCNGSAITVTKAYIAREVPEEEWKEWID